MGEGRGCEQQCTKLYVGVLKQGTGVRAFIIVFVKWGGQTDRNLSKVKPFGGVW